MLVFQLHSLLLSAAAHAVLLLRAAAHQQQHDHPSLWPLSALTMLASLRRNLRLSCCTTHPWSSPMFCFTQCCCWLCLLASLLQAGMMGMGAPAGLPGGLPGMMGVAAPAPAPGVMPGMAAAAFPGMPGVLPGPPSGGPPSDPMATPIPTPYLGVNGMITADVLSSDEEYKEVSECVWLCVSVCLCVCGCWRRRWRRCVNWDWA